MASKTEVLAAKTYPQNLGMTLWALSRKPMPGCWDTAVPAYQAPPTKRTRHTASSGTEWSTRRNRKNLEWGSGNKKGGIREEVDAADYSGSAQGGGENRSQDQT
jgi:hypothetical protein